MSDVTGFFTFVMSSYPVHDVRLVGHFEKGLECHESAV